MEVDGIKPCSPECTSFQASKNGGAGTAQQLPAGAPIDEPHTKLERAAPIRAARVWTLLKPRHELDAQSVGVLLLPGQCPGLSKGHEVKVAIGLPKVLDVTYDP